MIVFDLRCGQGHVFESWFGSSAAYEEQREQGLIACPLCGDSTIEKAVMAPNIAPKGNQSPPPEVVKATLAALAEAQAKALEGSQWVGVAFTEKARAMHLGDAPAAPIHGQATLADAKALLEEGVPVAPLPFPIHPRKTAN